jgi:hypothetical protein
MRMRAEPVHFDDHRSAIRRRCAGVVVFAGLIGDKGAHRVRSPVGERQLHRSLESAKRTETCLRPPSSADFEVRIRAARCFGA